MATKNDITGDKIQTKGTLSKQGQENWDKIFRKKGIELTEQELADIEVIADIICYYRERKKEQKDCEQTDCPSKRLTEAHNGL